MKTYQELLNNNPHIQLATQYAKVDQNHSTIVCVYNYYSQVLPKENIPCEIHLVAFDQTGKQISYASKNLDSGGFAQINLSDVFSPFVGLVGVMLVPKVSLEELAQKIKNFKTNLGSGFYIIWTSKSGHVDTMHEWFAFSEGTTKVTNNYFILNHHPDVNHGFIITNPTSKAISKVQVEIYTPSRKVLGQSSIESIEVFGTREVELDKLFPQIKSWEQEHKKLGVCLRANLVSPPYTLELHRGGDFHIHHTN